MKFQKVKNRTRCFKLDRDNKYEVKGGSFAVFTVFPCSLGIFQKSFRHLILLFLRSNLRQLYLTEGVNVDNARGVYDCIVTNRVIARNWVLFLVVFNLTMLL